jgi:hypothetical protein
MTMVNIALDAFPIVLPNPDSSRMSCPHNLYIVDASSYHILPIILLRSHLRTTDANTANSPVRVALDALP